MRAQFNGLKALVDAVPAGPPGPQGPPFAAVVVDGVATLPAGESATVAAELVGADVHLSFGIPRGIDGLPGAAGQNGLNGAPGPQGPPFTSFTVDSVTTLEPFQPATVQATFDGTFVRLAFGIPRGQDGSLGITGTQGAPGEVTLAQLAGAIAGTANNTNPIATLEIPISDPPTQGELQQVLAKLNELIVGLRR
jgi:hypothetical protein